VVDAKTKFQEFSIDNIGHGGLNLFFKNKKIQNFEKKLMYIWWIYIFNVVKDDYLIKKV
jgi:hypothetical protein